MKVLSWRPFTPKWGNGEVTMEVRPLKVQYMIDLLPFFEGKTEEDYKPTDNYKVQQQSAELLEHHIRNLNGLEDDDGPVTVARLAEEVTFTALVVEVIMHLIKISKVMKEDEGN